MVLGVPNFDGVEPYDRVRSVVPQLETQFFGGMIHVDQFGLVKIGSDLYIILHNPDYLAALQAEFPELEVLEYE